MRDIILLLSGHFQIDTQTTDVDAVMLEIKPALAEEECRQERLRAAE